jgi:hypothetical protein
VGDSKSWLGDAESSLGDAESSLGDAKSFVGDAKSSLGDVQSDRRALLLLPVERCRGAAPPAGRLHARELTHGDDHEEHRFGRGFNDVCFGRRGPYMVLAAGSDGAVRLVSILGDAKELAG